MESRSSSDAVHLSVTFYFGEKLKKTKFSDQCIIFSLIYVIIIWYLNTTYFNLLTTQKNNKMSKMVTYSYWNITLFKINFNSVKILILLMETEMVVKGKIEFWEFLFRSSKTSKWAKWWLTKVWLSKIKFHALQVKNIDL